MRQSEGDSHGPRSHPRPGPSPRWVSGASGQAGTIQWMRREGSLAPPKPSAQSQRGEDTGRRGRPGQHEDPWLCGGKLPPRGSEGDGQKDLLPHSRPAWGCPHWAGATRSGGLQVPPAKPPGRFLQQLYPWGGWGGGTGAPSLASLPWSQSFSCTRLSSVMPWAASSARTLSR